LGNANVGGAITYNFYSSKSI